MSQDGNDKRLYLSRPHGPLNDFGFYGILYSKFELQLEKLLFISCKFNRFELHVYIGTWSTL